jgi:hypothetical protein
VRKILEITSRLVDWIKWRFCATAGSRSYVTSSTSSSSGNPRTTTSVSPERSMKADHTRLEYDAPKTHVEVFFDAISMYVLPDIDRLTNEIRPDKQGLRGCTIPLAMLLFAVIDLFGFLTRDDQNPNKKHTWKNFRYLLSRSGYFPPIYGEYWKRIHELYRHGVVHQIFPKASAIAKAGPNHPLMYEDNGFPVLNVDILSRDVVEAVGRIRRDSDKQLTQRMKNRLRALAKADDGQARKLWNKV